jgi:DNA repair protein RadD
VGWWQRRAPQLPAPSSVEEALQHIEALRQPRAIQVRPLGQYTEIVSARFE